MASKAAILPWKTAETAQNWPFDDGLGMQVATPAEKAAGVVPDIVASRPDFLLLASAQPFTQAGCSDNLGVGAANSPSPSSQDSIRSNDRFRHHWTFASLDRTTGYRAPSSIVTGRNGRAKLSIALSKRMTTIGSMRPADPAGQITISGNKADPDV
ncbi:hypothetical protein K1W69_19375 [Hoeflea sp. WL0058]|uniref:Uncharacterized protein n=1 Tax=Flavimaribacter sediminis TaxID=2865987 RepID=A0AAE2ZM14_9HYPH|nr:hypothetical protein [Flavimaribacter sediminis]MBW8639364.1 hypothetical protein [Flavimaribacter sediminis]